MFESTTAVCVQRFDDSRGFADHITYRILLRSSSLREPRYPLLRVVYMVIAMGSGGFTTKVPFEKIVSNSLFVVVCVVVYYSVFVSVSKRNQKRQHLQRLNGLSTKQNVTHSIILQQCVKRLRHELTLMTTACFLKRNDPSAGSPTDTLLRLLLPLNDTI